MHLTRVLGLIFLLMTGLATTSVSRADSGFAPIEVRFVAQMATGGPKLAVKASDQMLEVEAEPLLGPVDFVSVGAVEWVEGKPGFNVALTPAGARKYEQISTENVGRTLAIIVDGKIRMTPKILDPVRAQGFLLTLNSETEARKLSDQVRQAVGKSAPND